MTNARTIQWRDTPQHYGVISRALHWAMAALILWQLTGMILKVTLGRTPLVSFFVGHHQQLGTIIAVLIVARGLWAFANLRSRPPHGDGALGWAAKAGHIGLYGLMVAIPMLALLRAWGNPRAFAPFGFEIFPARSEPVSWAVELANMLHGELGWLLLAVIVGHIAMVAVHQGLWRDGTLLRMAGRRR